jgi:hypothetical protein
LKGKVIGKTSVGGSYKIIEIGNEWVKIQFGQLAGWVSKALVTIR